MTNHYSSKDRVEFFSTILEQERKMGFKNKAYSGGLEPYLQILISEHTSYPELKALFENGLLHVQYSEFSVEEREIWFNEVQSYLGAEPKRKPEELVRKGPLPAAIREKTPTDSPLSSTPAGGNTKDQPTPNNQLINENNLENLLKDAFGYSTFKPYQREIIDAILAKRNILAVMPTGGGKSLCYQLPAIYSKQQTVVISPLIALIDDQVAGLSQLGIQASKIHSNLSIEEQNEQMRLFISGDSKIIYMSPEKLMQQTTIRKFQSQSIGLFVVDEAHCISQWGHEFRPDYGKLGQLKSSFPGAVIAAFTATATSITQKDIVEQLTNGDCRKFIGDFDRPNLSLEILRVTGQWEKDRALNKFLSARKDQSGIIFCLSRTDTDEVCTKLQQNGFNAVAYHGHTPAEDRTEAQDRFMTEDPIIMVATNAFGMGVDKANIRYIVHRSVPQNLEAFYQEIGRAGRDGHPAETLMLYSPSDVTLREGQIDQSPAGKQFKDYRYQGLKALRGYCETRGCRRIQLLSYFDQPLKFKCGNCDNCRPVPKTKYTAKARTKTIPRTIRQRPVENPQVFKKAPTLLEELRKLRLQIAKEKKINPVFIFSDLTLMEMAKKMPSTAQEFMSIMGVGKLKVEEYYLPFTNVIKRFKS